MNITIDNRLKDITYIDKSNNNIAKNKDIIKLITSKNIDKVSIFTNIITSEFNLNNVEHFILNYIFIHENVTITDIRIKISKLINKSTSTITRAIVNLRKHNLIYIDSKNVIRPSININIDVKNINNSKFIIIEFIDENKSITI